MRSPARREKVAQAGCTLHCDLQGYGRPVAGQRAEDVPSSALPRFTLKARAWQGRKRESTRSGRGKKRGSPLHPVAGKVHRPGSTTLTSLSRRRVPSTSPPAQAHKPSTLRVVVNGPLFKFKSWSEPTPLAPPTCSLVGPEARRSPRLHIDWCAFSLSPPPRARKQGSERGAEVGARPALARKPLSGCLGVSLAVGPLAGPARCRRHSWLWSASSEGSGGEGPGARLARFGSRRPLPPPGRTA